MAVVLERTIKNTKIRIHDDYFRNTTPEQIQRILERVVSRAKAGLVAASEEERT